MSVDNPIAARLHLLRAHDAPVIVIVRRGAVQTVSRHQVEHRKR